MRAMRKLVQRLANRFGYRIRRVTEATAASDPFLAMRQLLEDVDRPVIFDVGAHRGRVALGFRALFPDARIYAFEPFAESFHALEETVRGAGITALPFGLSDRSGTQMLHANALSATNSLLATDPRGATAWGPGVLDTKEVVPAEFRTIDRTMNDLQLERIDLLKLDVQGAETRVMAGAEQACRDGRIRLVYSEIITKPTYEGQPSLDEALRSFAGHGFDLHNIYNLNSTPGGALRQVDAIFTRRSASRG
jgi:FkbM family methyltransferase